MNSWWLKQKHKDTKEPYLDFPCDLIVEMMSVVGQERKKERKRKLTLDSDTLRFDNVGHWIVSTPAGKDGKPCRCNCKKCTIDGRKDAKAVNMC